MSAEVGATLCPHVLMTGASFTFVEDWARCARDVARVTLVEPHRRGPAFTCAKSDYGTLLTIRESAVRPSRLFERLNVARERRFLDRALTALDLDPIEVVHTHFYSAAGSAAAWAVRSGVRLVHTEHSSWIVSGRISPAGRRRLLDVCEAADVVYAVSAPLADAMRGLGVTADIRVLGNPVDIDRFTPNVQLRTYHPEAPTFITIGWLLERKDHHRLIEAFSEVHRRLPRARLVIVGDGPLRASLDSLVERRGLSSHVDFCGRLTRTEVAERLAAADVYVHTSMSETFGVSIVEAWASGLPVVTFDCGGVSSRADAFGGRLVVERDVALLADAMMSVTARISPEASSAIRAECESEFGPAVARESLRNAYSPGVEP